MTVALPIVAAGTAASPWRTHLIALGALAAVILALFHRDAADVAAIWWNSSTYNHCLLIPPIITWLVSQRLPELRALTPSAWAPGLLLVAIGAGGWLLGEAGGLGLARHAGLVLMLQGAVVAILGPAVARGLAFPIFYALFLIPAGEELVPAMQRLTAEMAMGLLALAGIPAHIEGIFISTPSGYFEVAEACAGVKFLIAMVALGALVANTCFRAPRRRVAFLAAAIIIPVLANGVRAFGTIYVAHWTSVETASGFDHIVYGWVFFAIVITLILAAGWRFFDRKPGDPWFDPARLQAKASRPRSPVPVAIAALLLAILPFGWTQALASADVTPNVVLPPLPGWTREPPGDWRPRFAGADAVRHARYRDRSGRRVDLVIAVFARQAEGRELVGFGQGDAEGWAWTGTGAAPAGGRLDRIASHGRLREVATFYRVGDTLTGSPAAVKWETMRTRLLGGPQRAVAILVSAEAPAEGVSPRPAIDDLLSALGPVARLADRAAGLPGA